MFISLSCNNFLICFDDIIFGYILCHNQIFNINSKTLCENNTYLFLPMFFCCCFFDNDFSTDKKFNRSLSASALHHSLLD